MNERKACCNCDSCDGDERERKMIHASVVFNFDSILSPLSSLLVVVITGNERYNVIPVIILIGLVTGLGMRIQHHLLPVPDDESRQSCVIRGGCDQEQEDDDADGQCGRIRISSG